MWKKGSHFCKNTVEGLWIAKAYGLDYQKCNGDHISLMWWHTRGIWNMARSAGSIKTGWKSCQHIFHVQSLAKMALLSIRTGKG